jgi:hypothetical protein
MNNFGMKELYGVTLKTTSILEINGEIYEEDEPILSFEKIQIGSFDEIKDRRIASGGVGNTTRIIWNDTKGMNIQISEGIVSKIGLSLISNSKIFRRADDLVVPYNEILESEKDENGNYVLNLRYPLFKRPYVRRNGEKITNFSFGNLDEKGRISVKNVDDEAEIEPPVYVVYYDYIYEGNQSNMVIGQRAVRGAFLSLTGRMRVKDDQTGKEVTCLVNFPKVELISDLTLRLGEGVTPYVYGFHLLAHPVGERGNQYVGDYIILDRDIDCDI